MRSGVPPSRRGWRTGSADRAHALPGAERQRARRTFRAVYQGRMPESPRPPGDRHVRLVIAEYLEHYHRERNHQGLHNELIAGAAARCGPSVLSVAAGDSVGFSTITRERREGTSADRWDSTRFSSIRYAIASRSWRSSQPVSAPSTICIATTSITTRELTLQPVRKYVGRVVEHNGGAARTYEQRWFVCRRR